RRADPADARIDDARRGSDRDAAERRGGHPREAPRAPGGEPMSATARSDGPFSTIEEAIEEIRRGRMVVVCDDEDRENEGDLVMAAQFVTPESINFMTKQARGFICLA